MTMEKLYEDYPTYESRIGKWDTISIEYLLTEEFILGNYNFLDTYYVCKYQSLPDILKLKLLLKYPYNIVQYQKLSEQFISDNWDILKHYTEYIANYQLLSPEFREKYDLNRYINHRTNWLYWSDRKKATYIKLNTDYELQSDNQGKYILACNGIRADGYSVYNWQIQYEVGKTYESVNNCNCDSNEEASSGLSAWYEQDALDYCDEKLLLVKIYLKDLGVIVKDDHRIRCRKLTVIEDVEV